MQESTTQDVIVNEFKGPCRAYKAMRGIAFTSLENKVVYIDQTEIPNALKMNEEERKMILITLHEAGQYPFKTLIGHELDSTTFIHVAKGHGEMVYRGEKGIIRKHTFRQERTYQINQCDTDNLFLKFRTNHMTIIALDILEKLPDELPYEHPQPLEKFDYTPPMLVRNYKYSFLRSDMQLQEIRNRLLFLDIECAQDNENNQIPVSIAAMDYEGNILMNTLVCPRKHIANYGTRYHGLTENDVYGKTDSVIVLRNLEKLLRGRIIVGHDLHMEQKSLDINLKRIAGIRDIQSSIALKKRMRSDKQAWSLKEVAITLDTQLRQPKIHNALGDVKIIREVYKKLEPTWQDTPKEIIEQLRGPEETVEMFESTPVIRSTRLSQGHTRWVETSGSRKRKVTIDEEEVPLDEEYIDCTEEQVVEEQAPKIGKQLFVPPPMPSKYLSKLKISVSRDSDNTLDEYEDMHSPAVSIGLASSRASTPDSYKSAIEKIPTAAAPVRKIAISVEIEGTSYSGTLVASPCMIPQTKRIKMRIPVDMDDE